MSQLVHELEKEYGPEKVLHITYRGLDAASPFYSTNERDHDYRFLYYGVRRLPYVTVDGEDIASHRVRNPRVMRETIDNALNTRSPLSITARVRMDTLTWEMTAEVIGKDEVPDVDLVLQFAVVQREAHFDRPFGTNGQKDFYNEMRWMLPSGRGETFRIAKGERREFAQSIPTSDIERIPTPESVSSTPAGQMEDFLVIVFVQEYRSKRVLQAVTAFVVEPEPPKPTAVIPVSWGRIKTMFH